ncbi:magnesium transporter MgtE N-terminal domain-containing protein [Ferroacidibacillus organovorans]|uniref:Magnesium transporter MgtE intracellular domain-containing protein n=1 Tax=Ferroacidibacillus organovorans TaxID=1765683 RepID=A0A162UYN4_9BACL|nr:hypothetical protein [Ferroacidibacillus organovorans]KYP82156.1 hypothetical protein AYJ22_00440 [Ferroacidibacillus organovorans]OAG94439.1 hypothetical protein AYW79_05330 [Ferroacidibacillus organovorans]OPG15676.1 hypothetical protein B2M26_11520 [Ferroacidibacillus organovorans]
MEEAVKRKSRSLSFLFYMILLPLLVSVILVIGALQILGYNVVGNLSRFATQNPVIRHSIGLPPLAQPIPVQVKALRGQLTAAQKTLQNLHDQLTRENHALLASQSLAVAEKTKISALEKQVATSQKTLSTAKGAAAVYMNMSPSQAAQIMQLQPFAQQVAILRSMDQATQASILSGMPPKLAAKLIQAGA